MRFFTVLLLFSTLQSFGVDFTKLNRDEPVSTVYPSNFKCYVDVSLFLDATKVFNAPIFLRISYIIGTDTLNDNLTINGSHDAVIKRLFLDEGERLTAVIHLNNGETNEIDGLEGSFRIVRNPDFKPDDQGKNTFLSGVWKSDQTPLFRVGIKNSTPQVFRLKFTLNENFEFNNLYLKIKVISPSAGIVMLDKTVKVNEGAVLNLGKKSFSVDMSEVDLSTHGTYYFQVMQNMTTARVNGVDKINYEIVPE